jgi:hypothetical protein
MSKWMIFTAVFAAACAQTPASDQVGTTELKEGVTQLGKAVQLGSTRLLPMALEEDSRCPVGVQCIHAGTVRVQVRVHEASGSRLSSVALRQPLQLVTGWLHLTSVCPPRLASADLAASDYLFRFMILPNAAPLEPRDRCH